MSLNPRQFDGYFHGTDADSAEKIQKEGFSLDYMANARDAGEAVYLTKDRGHAAEYAFGVTGPDPDDEWSIDQARRGRVIPVKLEPRNPYVGWPQGGDRIHAAALRRTQLRSPQAAHPYESEITEELHRRGHDAWITDKNLALALDPKIVKPAGRALDFEAFHGRTVDDEVEERRAYWS